MGLKDAAAQAAQLRADTNKAEAIAAAMAEWERRLNRARTWWAENIGEPAEFFHHNVAFSFHGGVAPVIAVCDGWTFLIAERGAVRRFTGGGYCSHADDQLLAAYLLRALRRWPERDPDGKPMGVEFYKTKYGDPRPCTSLADIGLRLAEWEADDRVDEPPDPEELITRNVRWK